MSLSRMLFVAAWGRLYGDVFCSHTDSPQQDPERAREIAKRLGVRALEAAEAYAEAEREHGKPGAPKRKPR